MQDPLYQVVLPAVEEFPRFHDHKIWFNKMQTERGIVIGVRDSLRIGFAFISSEQINSGEVFFSSLFTRADKARYL